MPDTGYLCFRLHGLEKIPFNPVSGGWHPASRVNLHQTQNSAKLDTKNSDLP